MAVIRVSIALALLLGAAPAWAQRDETIAVLSIRPTNGPDAYATRLELLPDANSLRQTIESVVVATSGRQAASTRQVQRLLGSKYIISLYDCGGRIPCIEKVLKPLKSSAIGVVVDGDYFEEGSVLVLRLRFFDTREAKLKSEISFRLPAAQRADLAAWSREIAPVFQDTGALTVNINVPDATCELDRKPCELDSEGTIATVPEGEHTLWVSATGYGEERKIVTVTRGETTRVDFTLQRLNMQGLEPYQAPQTQALPVVSTVIQELKPLVEINGGIEPTWAYVVSGAPLPPLRGPSSFYLRRVFVSFSGSLVPWAGYRVSLEFGQFQLEDAPISGPLRDAHIWFRHWGQELRIGQFKVPFGWERYNSALALPLNLRSIITPRLTTEYGRDIGAGIFGTIALGEHWRIEDAISLTNGTGINTIDSNGRKDVSGRLGIAYDQLFFAGVSAATAEVTRADGVREDTKRFDFDVRLESRYVFAVLETAYAIMTAPIDTTQYGGFLIFMARLPLDLELGARLEYLDPNSEAPGSERRITGLFKYEFIPEQLMLIINYEHGLTPMLLQTESIFGEPLPKGDILRVGTRIRF